MTDFAAARRMMVDGQVRTADVTDLRLIAAMQEVRRERFVPDDRAALAYLDLDLPMGEGGRRRLLKPMVLAKLIQLAEIGEGDRVLDVGCGSGYAAAVLARLAARVVALDEEAALTRRAAATLAMIGGASVKVATGPLTQGWPADGPYDAILVEGAIEVVPEPLLRQLRDGGRLVCVMGAGAGGKAMLYRAVGGEFSGRAAFEANAALLPGFIKQAAFVF